MMCSLETERTSWQAQKAINSWFLFVVLAVSNLHRVQSLGMIKIVVPIK